MNEFVERFLDNFGKLPEPGPERIPKRWRIPFFLGLAVISLLALVIVVRFVVVPAIDAQQSGADHVQQSGPPQ